MSKLLINETPLVVLPSLVTKLNGNYTAAIVLQQIHYLCQQPRSGVNHEGHKWVWFTYEEFVENYMPWLSPMTIRNTIRNLEHAGLIASTSRVRDRWDSTKFYRVNEESLENIIDGIPEGTVDGTVEDTPGGTPEQESDGTFEDTPGGTPIYTKTSSKTSSKTSTNTHGGDADFALATIRENYRILPRFHNHRQQEMWLDDHVDLVAEYGRAAYAKAVAECKAGGIMDGKKADHVERVLGRINAAQEDKPQQMKAVLLEEGA